jgi:PhzF family phenazine biosynthesis protein
MISDMRIYQVDAFNDAVFKGNPAAVCPLDHWIPDDVMQQIAEENNLSETAFFVKNQAYYDLRWFTPMNEIDLCGHATLAAAHVLFTELEHEGEEIVFKSKSGLLNVRRSENGYTLNFPAEQVESFHPEVDLSAILGVQVHECFKGKWKLLVHIDKEEDLEALDPDFYQMAKMKEPGIIVTAKGSTADFVSRFFAPKLGIDEDPVTGSAHTLLIPYWAALLGKDELSAIQLSRRRGILQCKNLGNRVEMTGQAVTYMKGTITITS